MKNFTQKFIGLLALVFTMSSTVNAQGGPPPPPGNTFGCFDPNAINYSDVETEGPVECEYSEAYIQMILDSLLYANGYDVNTFSNAVAVAYANGAASVDITSDNQTAFDAGVASVATQNIPLDLPQGWSMFGYTCLDSVDAMVGFSAISDKIEIVKDEWGLSYLPSWDFNAMGSLQFSEGYQIKMIEEVTAFQFCTTIAGGASQEELDAAYAEGAASVTPEDGVTQADVDAVQSQLEVANQTISELQTETNWNYPPDTDEISWEMMDLYGYEIMEYWDLAQNCLNGDGYACVTAASVLMSFNMIIPQEIFSCVGNSDSYYAASYECPAIINNYPELLSEFFGYTYELDECGVVGGNNSSCTDGCGVVNGDNSSCADECGIPNGDNSSCTDECGVLNGDNSSCADECGVPNGDNSTCLDCAGVPNGTSEDLGCGCDIPGAQDGYDCNGNLLQIGDITAGGIIFEINEDGTGLVAAFQDLYRVVYNESYFHMDWAMAMSIADNYTSQGYDDWRLPSIEELELMYYTIGQGADNSGGFEDWNYWSSTFEGNCNFGDCEDASSFHFGEGNYVSWWADNPGSARAIRAF